MLKKTITYKDFDGNERTEDFYFNLKKSEILEMHLETVGGLKQMLETIIAKQDAPKLTTVFKELILKSYGEKTPDGKRFVKSPELSKEFEETNAYDILFMELMDANNAAAFVNGIIPAELAEEVERQKAITNASGNGTV